MLVCRPPVGIPLNEALPDEFLQTLEAVKAFCGHHPKNQGSNSCYTAEAGFK